MNTTIILFGYLVSVFPILYTIWGLKKQKEKSLGLIFFLLLGVGIFFNLLAGIILRTSTYLGLSHLEARNLIAPMRYFEVFLSWFYFAVFKFLEK